jgi:hypothetical protein
MGSVLVVFIGLGRLCGQDTPYQPPGPPEVLPAPAPLVGQPPAAGVAPPTGLGEPAPVPHGQLSEWIVYPRAPRCCGPVGGDGPVGTEFYFRIGPSFPITKGDLNALLLPGLAIQGGGRTLFFNPAMDRAWAVDLGLTNISNNTITNPHPITLRNITTDVDGQATDIPIQDVTVDSLNRTSLQLGIGRERYLWGSAAHCPDNRYLRVGWDLGGRWGSSMARFNEIQRLTDTIGGVYFAIHADVERPCGPCLLQAGLRCEWAYTWSDILRGENNSDTHDITLYGTFGFRY